MISDIKNSEPRLNGIKNQAAAKIVEKLLHKMPLIRLNTLREFRKPNFVQQQYQLGYD